MVLVCTFAIPAHQLRSPAESGKNSTGHVGADLTFARAPRRDSHVYSEALLSPEVPEPPWWVVEPVGPTGVPPPPSPESSSRDPVRPRPS